VRLLSWLPLGKVPEIHSRRLAVDLDAVPPPQILDVRTEGEFRRGHVPGAVSVPITALPERLASLALDRRRPVIAICLSAHRSIPAVRLLREAGYDAAQLRGGMLAWRAAGYPEQKC
jgi:rhodanese-related sulfurtransferase